MVLSNVILVIDKLESLKFKLSFNNMRRQNKNAIDDKLTQTQLIKLQQAPLKQKVSVKIFLYIEPTVK